MLTSLLVLASERDIYFNIIMKTDMIIDKLANDVPSLHEGSSVVCLSLVTVYQSLYKVLWQHADKA